MNKFKLLAHCVVVLLGINISANASEQAAQKDEVYLKVVEQFKVFMCEGNMVQLIGNDKVDCKKNVSSVSLICKQEVFKKFSAADLKEKYRDIQSNTSRCLTREAIRLKKSNQTSKNDAH